MKAGLRSADSAGQRPREKLRWQIRHPSRPDGRRHMQCKLNRADEKPGTLADYVSRRGKLGKTFFAFFFEIPNPLAAKPKSIHILWTDLCFGTGSNARIRRLADAARRRFFGAEKTSHIMGMRAFFDDFKIIK
jgi:hypothetical protein